MLQQMRRVPKWVSSVFLAVVSLSFGVWGIADIFRGGADTSVATIGGTKIDQQEFSRDFSNGRNAATARSGGQLSPARATALAQSTLQHEINDAALENAANSLGLVATDEQVSSAIREIPAFHGVLGSFDQDAFQRVLQRINYTEAGFVAEVRSDLQREQLLRAGSSALMLPEGYVRTIFAYLNERRAAQYIVLPQDAGGSVPAPTDAVLSAYVKAHANTFSTPEYRELTYAVIGPEDVQKDIQVTDTQLRQAYDLRKDTYVIPERRDVERINFLDEASAKAARAKIDAGAKFEDIATARGLSPAELNVPGVAQADLGPIQGPAAFALPAGGITQPLKNTFGGGWSLLRVKAITPGKTTTFDQAKPDLQAELNKELAGSRLEDKINDYDDAHNSGDEFAQAAKKVGMRVIHVAAVDAHGLAPDGSKAQVAASADFLDQVFKSDIGNEGDPFRSQDGHYYILKVDGVIPQKLKPLDAVRAQATALWSEDERLQMLANKARELANDANTSGSLDAIAGQYHASVQTSVALDRDAASGALNQNLVTKIFASMPGKSVYGPTSDGKSFIVARISGVFHIPLPLGDPRFQQFAQALSREAGSDVQSGMAGAARAEQGVTINQPQVNRVAGGES